MCRSPPADTLIGSCGRSIWARDGLCLVSKTPKWAVPDEKVRVWKSSSTQIYPNLRYCWGKTLPPFLTKQTGSGSMRMRFSTSSIVCFSPYPAELTNLNTVTSHVFLPPAPLFPVKSPIPEMPKSPAVAQRCQSNDWMYE